jgi:ArsR family metal-binding transcriptional regulator
MRRYQNIPHKIAAISPCIAKANEFEETGNLVSYNVTFKKLEEYITRNFISLPNEPGNYDHPMSGLGAVYSYPGGLKENVEFFLGKALRVDKSEGQSVVYKTLEEFGEETPENWPAVFDVLNCSEGCNLGTGTVHGQSVFKVGTAMENVRKKALTGREHEYFDQMFADFDKNLTITDFIRHYYPRPVMKRNVTKQELDAAFNALGKTDESSRKFNCGACGARTCEKMAEKIVKKVNIVENCLKKMHDDMEREHKVVMDWRDGNNNALHALGNEMDSIHTFSGSISSDIGQIRTIVRDYEVMAREIDKIADNIHIISLNASIEAAKAGDNGKSFAVVADEIRSLAGKTQVAITQIGKSTETAKNTMSEVEEKVKNIVNKIEAASENLKDINSRTEFLSRNSV